jgi:hypothetical protein
VLPSSLVSNEDALSPRLLPNGIGSNSLDLSV